MSNDVHNPDDHCWTHTCDDPWMEKVHFPDKEVDYIFGYCPEHSEVWQRHGGEKVDG